MIRGATALSGKGGCAPPSGLTRFGTVDRRGYFVGLRRRPHTSSSRVERVAAPAAAQTGSWPEHEGSGLGGERQALEAAIRQREEADSQVGSSLGSDESREQPAYIDLELEEELGVEVSLEEVEPEVERMLQEKNELVAQLRVQLAAQEAEIAALQKRSRVERRKFSVGRQKMEAQVAELKAEAETMDKNFKTARLAAMVYRLGEQLHQELELDSVVAASGFGEIVTATSSVHGEVIVKFSQQRAWRCWSGNQGENLALLRRESDSLAFLNALPGGDRHVVRLVEPYAEFTINLGDGQSQTIGAIIIEKGSWNMGTYVKSNLSKGTKEGLALAATAVKAWEDSVKWLHSHGILHLDIKADNAIWFEDGSVKLIDVAGMLTRGNISADSSNLDSMDLVWDTADLEEQGVTFVSTVTYRQPVNLGPGRRFLDYSADWWSMGVSKMEVLGAQPSFFENGQETAKRVWQSMGSGELEEALRTQMATVLLEPDPHSEEVSVWVDSVMQNLQGRPARVDYFNTRKFSKKASMTAEQSNSRWARVSEDSMDDDNLHLDLP